ncbi:MAG: LysM peptidoglycan-binding domain-containing protein [Firmicutes bacterium]|nr:LysM peptidoglycan-binding domain-containing protein [Bacillota bacterium]
MNRTRRVQINTARLFSTVILLGMLLAMTAFAFSQYIHISFSLSDLRHSSPAQYTIIKVAEGDSVWSLAQSYNGSEKDLRKSVDMICEVNSLDNYVIHPGDELLIPVY